MSLLTVLQETALAGIELAHASRLCRRAGLPPAASGSHERITPILTPAACVRRMAFARNRPAALGTLASKQRLLVGLVINDVAAASPLTRSPLDA